MEKKKKKNGITTTYTTGGIPYNINQFNKRMGTVDNNNPTPTMIDPDPTWQAAENNFYATAGEGSDGVNSTGEGTASARGEGGMCGESKEIIKNGETLTEETKRYVKRYYIRPQNIVCSNKADILKALIEIGDKNCSVYSLKRLSDHDDAHLLTNKDIIYYYDDGILYDKNHVKVMDYELRPKHEEERKKVSGDINNISNREFVDMYDDRLTDADLTKDEVIKESAKPAQPAQKKNLKEEMESENPLKPAFAFGREHKIPKGDGIAILKAAKVTADRIRGLLAQDETIFGNKTKKFIENAIKYDKDVYFVPCEKGSDCENKLGLLALNYVGLDELKNYYFSSEANKLYNEKKKFAEKRANVYYKFYAIAVRCNLAKEIQEAEKQAINKELMSDLRKRATRVKQVEFVDKIAEPERSEIKAYLQEHITKVQYKLCTAEDELSFFWNTGQDTDAKAEIARDMLDKFEKQNKSYFEEFPAAEQGVDFIYRNVEDESDEHYDLWNIAASVTFDVFVSELPDSIKQIIEVCKALTASKTVDEITGNKVDSYYFAEAVYRLFDYQLGFYKNKPESKPEEIAPAVVEEPVTEAPVEEAEPENPFDLTFESYDACGNKILTEGKAEEPEVCCICGEEIEGYGNNPEPYKEEGRCCDSCNLHFVIPARLELYMQSKKEK